MRKVPSYGFGDGEQGKYWGNEDEDNDDDDDDNDVNGVGGGGEHRMSFDGGIHFRGTLVSGRLLNSRGFRDRGGQVKRGHGLAGELLRRRP